MAQNQNHQRGLALYEAGQLQPALTAFRAAAEEYRAAGDQVLAGEMLNNVGVVLRGLKDWNAAVSAVEEALELFRALADRMREAGALGNLGAILLDKGDLRTAGEALTAAVQIYNDLNADEERGYVLNLLGQVRIKQGRHYDGLLDMEEGLQNIAQLTPQQKWLKGLLKLPAKLLRGL